MAIVGKKQDRKNFQCLAQAKISKSPKTILTTYDKIIFYTKLF